VADDHGAELAADHRLVAVQHGRYPEPPGNETTVVRQGTAEVTGTDDHHGPVLRQPQSPRDLINKVLDVVTDTSDPIRTEVAQVLAELGRIDAGRRREFVAGDGGHASVRQRVEGAKVDREPGHGGFRDAAGVRTLGGLPVVLLVSQLAAGSEQPVGSDLNGRGRVVDRRLAGTIGLPGGAGQLGGTGHAALPRADRRCGGSH
jgi:hypothetical protein